MTDDLRAGVIGLGFGANHARILGELAGVCLAAVADADPERCAPFEAAGARAYSDSASMLAAERLDAVVVALPAHLHVAAGCAAIATGAAVLVEKPLAPSYADAKRLVDAARSAGIILMPGHIERFNPAVIELDRRVKDGQLGRVLQVTARRMSAMRAGPHGSRLPPTDVNVVHDSAIHDIDAARCILGLEVESVYGIGHAGVVTGAEDSISAVLQFGASQGLPAPVMSLDVNWLAPRRVRDLTVLGERGMFHLDYAAQSLALYRPAGEEPEQLAVEGRDQLEAELEAFVAAVRDGARLPVTPEDGLAAVAIADAITRSARSGEPVSLTAVTS
jgi:predicted dehydrogenase